MNAFTKTLLIIVVIAIASAFILDVALGASKDIVSPNLDLDGGDGNGRLEQLIASDGTKLAYRVWETDSEPRAAIALFHGGGGHSGQPTFTHFIKHFNDIGFAVYGLDQRGHGYSEGHRLHVESMEQLRADMNLFVEHVRGILLDPTKRVFGIGQSMGGLYLLDYSREFPESLDGVVITAPGLAPHGIPKAAQIATRFGNIVAPRWQFKLPAPDYSALTRDTKEVARVHADKLSMLAGTSRTMVNILETIERVNNEAADFSTPLLMAHGSDDAFADPSGSKDFFDKVQSADKKLLLYQDAYHQLYLEINREEFFQDVEEWMVARL